MRISFSRFSAIGLDVGWRWVKAAQLARSGEGWRLAACTVFPRMRPDGPATPAELRQIATILRRQGFVGRDVVVPAPGDKLRSGIVELPAKAAGVPMEQLARAEFGRVQKIDVAASEFSWWELPSSSRAGKGTVVMAVAYPHTDADPLAATFEEAGFRVRGMDTPTSALARGCLPLVQGKRSFGALDIGATAGVLVLVRDDVVVYERRIPEAGIARLSAALEERLGTGREAAEYVIQEIGLAAAPPGEMEDRFAEARGMIARHIDAVISEVRRTLAYSSHQYSDAAVETLLLCGGGASIPGVCEHVAANVETQVTLAAIGPGLDCAQQIRERIGVYPACAVGLARFL